MSRRPEDTESPPPDDEDAAKRLEDPEVEPETLPEDDEEPDDAGA